MNMTYVHTLYGYSAWANGRILDTAARLTQEQLTRKIGASFDSIRDTIVHTMSGQWIWLARWQSLSPERMLDPAAFADIPAIRRRWEQIEAETQAFLAKLAEADLDRLIEYRNTEGEPWAYPLWQALVHQVNHATQHRSEAAAMLTQLGCSPGWLDFLVYIDQQTTGGG